LSDSGSGTFDDVIAGILWTGEEIKNSGKVAIVSMSLGGPKSRAVDEAIAAATEAGAMFVAAAGNSYGADACKVSPAGAVDAFTVGATNSMDRLASFSNTGPCVAILAPGENVLSTWNNGASKTISGTSM
jgi:subtilisin family serine protease